MYFRGVYASVSQIGGVAVCFEFEVEDDDGCEECDPDAEVQGRVRGARGGSGVLVVRLQGTLKIIVCPSPLSAFGNWFIQ